MSTPMSEGSVEFRGQRLTRRGAMLEMGAVVERAQKDVTDVIDAWPDGVEGADALSEARDLMSLAVDELRIAYALPVRP
jgi:hypothetical protein